MFLKICRSLHSVFRLHLPKSFWNWGRTFSGGELNSLKGKLAKFGLTVETRPIRDQALGRTVKERFSSLIWWKVYWSTKSDTHTYTHAYTLGPPRICSHFSEHLSTAALMQSKNTELQFSSVSGCVCVMVVMLIVPVYSPEDELSAKKQHSMCVRLACLEQHAWMGWDGQ